MSSLDHKQWTGFPFSASRIRAGRRLQDSKIIAPSIPEAVPVPADPAPVAPLLPAPRIDGRGAALQAGQPVGRPTGLRLLPLQAFTWGSGITAPQPRTRPDHSLIWVRDGQVQLDLVGSRDRLGPGDLRLVAAGTPFAAIPSAGAQGHVALISAELAARAHPPLPKRGMAAQVGAHAAQLQATLHELAVETRNPQPETLDCLMNLLSLRLGRLTPDPRRAEAAGDGAPNLPPPDLPPPDLPLIDRFLALADQHLGSARSVPELAADLGCTTAALDQACLTAHGKRAIELIHDRRLARAADLLRHSDRSSQRIAADLGYCSQAHFIRSFVAATGRTPEAFRAHSRLNRVPGRAAAKAGGHDELLG